MKNLFYILLPACVLALTSCSSDTEPFDIEETDSLTLDMRIIGVGLPESDCTRVQMNELTDMVWTAGDHLDVYGYVDDVCMSPEVFNLVGGEGTKTGVFAGHFAPEWQSFELSYKGAKVEYAPNEANSVPRYAYLDQTQTALNNFEHLRDHLLLRSGIHSSAVTSQLISIKPQCAILKINVNNLPEAIKNTNNLDVSFYITNPSAQQVRNAKVHLSGTVIPDADNFIYMAFEPAHDLKPGGELGIGFVADGKEYKASVVSADGKSYMAGMIYTVTIDYNNPGVWKWTLP